MERKTRNALWTGALAAKAGDTGRIVRAQETPGRPAKVLLERQRGAGPNVYVEMPSGTELDDFLCAHWGRLVQVVSGGPFAGNLGLAGTGTVRPTADTYVPREDALRVAALHWPDWTGPAAVIYSRAHRGYRAAPLSESLCTGEIIAVKLSPRQLEELYPWAVNTAP